MTNNAEQQRVPGNPQGSSDGTQRPRPDRVPVLEEVQVQDQVNLHEDDFVSLFY